MFNKISKKVFLFSSSFFVRDGVVNTDLLALGIGDLVTLGGGDGLADWQLLHLQTGQR